LIRADLEDEARVVLELTAELGIESRLRDIGAALGQQRQAPLESVERLADVDVIALKKILDACACGTDRRRDGEIVLDEIGNGLRQGRRVRIEGNREQPFGDLADGARADRLDTMRVEIVLNQSLGLLRLLRIELGNE